MPRQVIIPGILLVDSWLLLTAACEKAKVRPTVTTVRQGALHAGAGRASIRQARVQSTLRLVSSTAQTNDPPVAGLL